MARKTRLVAELEDDWADLRPRTPLKNAQRKPPEVDEEWAQLKGLPEYVYFLDYRAVHPHTLRPLPLPQLWQFRVTGRKDGYFRGRQETLVWSMTELYSVTHVQAVLESECFLTLEKARTGLQEARGKAVGRIEKDMEKAREDIYRLNGYLNSGREAIKLLQDLSLPANPLRG